VCAMISLAILFWLRSMFVAEEPGDLIVEAA
jgi:hypothetical protein